jgi:hypothetical protein
MSRHGEAMTERLPQLYRDGDLVTSLSELVGLQLEILDEQARSIQRRHWFDTAPDLEDAAALGALLDIQPEPWQRLGTYRAWFHALRTARLRHGAVTGAALCGFVADYAGSFEATSRIDLLPDFDAWSARPTASGHAFIENPERSNSASLADSAGVVPLHQQTIVNAGLDPSPLSWVMVGTADAPEYVPVVANVTTGTALVYLGELRPGARLWLSGDDREVSAELEGKDVTGHLRTVTRLMPGDPWQLADLAATAEPVMLAPGDNELWFLPVAHFDEPGLDRALLALADLELEQGRWGQSRFDHALFFQDPAAAIALLWTETTPATVLVDLDAATMRSRAGQLDAALERRDQLAASVDQGVASLSAAGVDTTVRMRPLVSSQRQRDRLTVVLPATHREAGVVGIDRLPNAEGVFGVTDFDESTYR